MRFCIKGFLTGCKLDKEAIIVGSKAVVCRDLYRKVYTLPQPFVLFPESVMKEKLENYSGYSIL